MIFYPTLYSIISFFCRFFFLMVKELLLLPLNIMRISKIRFIVVHATVVR